MNRKELTKTFMMISIRIKPFGLHGLNKVSQRPKGYYPGRSNGFASRLTPTFRATLFHIIYSQNWAYCVVLASVFFHNNKAEGCVGGWWRHAAAWGCVCHYSSPIHRSILCHNSESFQGNNARLPVVVPTLYRQARRWPSIETTI